VLVFAAFSREPGLRIQCLTHHFRINSGDKQTQNGQTNNNNNNNNPFTNVNAWDGAAPHIQARGSRIKRVTEKKHEIQNLKYND